MKSAENKQIESKYIGKIMWSLEPNVGISYVF